MNVNNGKNTIEFRLSNGTLDPNTWMENIKLYGRTVQMAHEISMINMKLSQGEQITEEEKKKLQMKAMLKGDVTNDEKMEALMGLLFEEKEKGIYWERYFANKLLEEKEHRIEKMKFGRVDFENIYKSVEIPQDIIRNLSHTGREENKEKYQEK